MNADQLRKYQQDAMSGKNEEARKYINEYVVPDLKKAAEQNKNNVNIYPSYKIKDMVMGTLRSMGYKVEWHPAQMPPRDDDYITVSW